MGSSNEGAITGPLQRDGIVLTLLGPDLDGGITETTKSGYIGAANSRLALNLDQSLA